MKVPLSWLRDYVDVTLPVEQLAVRLTLAGLEVAGIRAVGLPVPEGVRVKPEDAGPVWDREKHPEREPEAYSGMEIPSPFLLRSSPCVV